jgi:hypothetical protein
MVRDVVFSRFWVHGPNSGTQVVAPIFSTDLAPPSLLWFRREPPTPHALRFTTHIRVVIRLPIIHVMDLHTIWHCARPKLARSYLALLGSGLVVSTTIFAPRRTGKTVFLRQDLQPAAIKAGYTVAYADLWQTRAQPGVALVAALEEALSPKTVGQRVMHRLATPLSKVNAKASLPAVGEAALELNLAPAMKPATEMALRIDELIGQLTLKRPVLFLVDEAQELARTKENEAVAMALRTAITKHRERLRVVFTGSSRSRLAHVFSDPQAPLYSVGAAAEDFPLLGREFAEFLVEKFGAAAPGRALDVTAVWQEFQAFDHRPEPMLKAVVALLMNPNLTLARACEQVRQAALLQDNHAMVWQSLEPLQRLVCQRALLEPSAAFFSKAVLHDLGAALHSATSPAGAPKARPKPLSPSSVQFALKGLAERAILVKTARGAYVFEDPAFERWLRGA